MKVGRMKSLLSPSAALIAVISCIFSAPASALAGTSAKEVSLKRSADPIKHQEKLRSLQEILNEKISRPRNNSNSSLGGVDSGGGNLIKLKTGEYRLLDTYLAKSSRSSSSLTQIPSLKIGHTRALRAWGVDNIITNTFTHEQFIFERLTLWQNHSPLTIALLKQALLKLPVYVVDYDLGLSDLRFYLPPDFNVSEVEAIETAAIYFKDFGVFISRRLFNLLSFEDQMGLILHESLRHVQVSYGLQMSDQLLQELTVSLLRDPRVGEKLELEGDLAEEVLAQAREKDSDIGVMKATRFQPLDLIIRDYNRAGWTTKKAEAQMILLLLHEAGIIQKP
jgi:hypothetical protein